MRSLETFMGGAVEVNVVNVVRMHKKARFWRVTSIDAGEKILELPDATTLQKGGCHFLIENYGPSTINIRRNGGGADLLVLASGQRVKLHLLDNSTAAGIWLQDVRANGPSGSVAKKHAAIIGGEFLQRDVLRFDPTSDAWSAGTPGTYNRDSAAAFQASSMIYCGGNWPIDAASAKFDRYYLDSWRSETDAPVATGRSGSGSALGNGYMISGHGIASVQEYNPLTRSWRAMKDIGYARSSPTCASISDKIYLACGKPFGAPNTIFSPLLDAFTSLEDYVGPQRERLSAFNALSAMYVCGGRESDGTTHDLVERLDTVTLTWTAAPVIPMGGRYGGASFSANGIGYFASGKNQANAVQMDAAEFWNNVWQAINPTTQGAFRVENTALPTP